MTDKPNIVIMMTDQQQARLCGREGFALDTTPYLDKLARSGTWFNRAYMSCPVCVPARISMLVGSYPSAHRIRCRGAVGQKEIRGTIGAYEKHVLDSYLVR